MATVTFQLTGGEVSEIQKTVNGQGGHQTLMSKLQAKLKPNGVIELTDAEIGKIVRYSQYGQGGFQGRFKAAFGRPFRESMT